MARIKQSKKFSDQGNHRINYLKENKLVPFKIIEHKGKERKLSNMLNQFDKSNGT